MKIRQRNFSLFIILLFSTLSIAQNQNLTYLSYIDQYHQIAVKQQKEHGIPASIVLAQGLLESGAGKSELSKTSNNHFGIKCTDWAGEKVYHDDDEKGECFRKYSKVLDSYEDHAQFLKTRPRYASLFLLKPTDYEGWAFGLKKAGYATDPSYAFKLISMIENYSLQKYDTGKYFTENTPNESNTPKSDYYGSIGTIEAFLSHEVLKVNGVRFVKAVPSDTYKSIADEFNISEKRIRLHNEVSSSAQLIPGMRAYISYKKSKALKGFDNYIVKAGDSMYSIAQDFGIKTVSLYKLNQMTFSQVAKVGQVLRLR